MHIYIEELLTATAGDYYTTHFNSMFFVFIWFKFLNQSQHCEAMYEKYFTCLKVDSEIKLIPGNLHWKYAVYGHITKEPQK